MGSSLPDCMPGAVKLTVRGVKDHKTTSTYGPHDKPTFEILVKNSGSADCKVDFGRTSASLTVLDADSKHVWGSDDCPGQRHRAHEGRGGRAGQAHRGLGPRAERGGVREAVGRDDGQAGHVPGEGGGRQARNGQRAVRSGRRLSGRRVAGTPGPLGRTAGRTR
ncbi:hypothetical protein NKH77_29830 [Streptomyces sp. M19]